MKLKKIFLVIFGFLTSLFSVDDFKRFLNDNMGGLILPFGDEVYFDEEWMEYKRLEIDESVKSVNPKDLPDDFCDEACRLVDEFHRKTVNEKVEWMLYFDYMTGEVIYCWKGYEDRIIGKFDEIYLVDRHVASIHSHTKDLYSFPSLDNFDILENSFEDFEIITSVDAFWIIEFKGTISKISRRRFQQCLREDMYMTIESIKYWGEDGFRIRNVTENIIGNYLLNEINNEIQGINLILIKRRYG